MDVACQRLDFTVESLDTGAAFPRKEGTLVKIANGSEEAPAEYLLVLVLVFLLDAVDWVLIS